MVYVIFCNKQQMRIVLLNFILIKFYIQVEKEVLDKFLYLCLFDFVVFKSFGKKDYIGMFVVTVGYGVDKMCKV